MKVNDYLRARVLQKAAHGCIVDGSTPVLAFGDPSNSSVATLGLNPSRAEFLNSDGDLLNGSERRLATTMSLRLRRLEKASDNKVQTILDDCASYFQRNPYRRWFDQLEPILNAVDVSYYDGTACHLDLVQWATDPTWGGLPTSERKALLQSDVPFLIQQLKSEPIETLLLNGRGVIRQFNKRIGVALKEVATLDEDGHQPTTILTGVAFSKVRVVAWSTNIQSSRGVTRERRAAIASAVAEALSKL